MAFPHRGLLDSEEVDLGGVTLRTIGTPGHTPEHLAYLLLGGSRPGPVGFATLRSPSDPGRSLPNDR